jgi:DNA (cytosine-5)-methyltransferase 1
MPVPAVTTKDRFGLVEPIVVQTDQTGSNGLCVRKTSEPLHTIVTKNNSAIIEPVAEPFIVQNRLYYGGKNDPTRAPHDIEKPLPTITGHGAGAVVEPVLESPDGETDPKRLVNIDGVLFKLDIRFRMLTNRELARAMGFDDEETEYEFLGTIHEVTKQIGNAVPVNTACALVKAILGENDGEV